MSKNQWKKRQKEQIKLYREIAAIHQEISVLNREIADLISWRKYDKESGGTAQNQRSPKND